MRARLSWGTVALLAVVFAGCAAALFAMSLRVAPSDDAAANTLPSYPDSVPLDFADAKTRSAFETYGRWLHDGVEPIAASCNSYAPGREIYRVELIDGMTSNYDDAFVAVDVEVAGNKARFEEKTLKKARDGKTRWVPVKTKYVGERDIAAIRSRANELLLSGIPAAIADQSVDDSEWTLQMCRRGRYHFYQRHTPQRDEKANAAFIATTGAVFELRKAQAAAP